MAGLAATPALANECPTLQAQIDAAFGNRVDGTAATVKALAHDAWALHQAGKHNEAVKKYDEAAKAGQIELKHMR
jgi:hypothetical protein